MCETQKSGIPYAERANGYMEMFAEEGGTITRILEVDQANRRNFLRDMLGDQWASGVNVQRWNPEYHPVHPKFFCQSVELVHGEGRYEGTEVENAIEFESYVYRCIYQAVPWDVREDGDVTDVNAPELSRNVERVRRHEVENLILPRGSFKYVTAPNNPVAENPPRSMPSQLLELTLHRWPKVPEANIRSCLGKINSGTFDHGKYAIGTVLFLGAEERRVMGPFGFPYYNIVMSFAIRDNGDVGGGVRAGHNYLYRSDTGVWDRVSLAGNPAGPFIYESENLNILFRLDS